MTWQMWLLVGLLATVLAGLGVLAWLQARTMAILRAEVHAGRDRVAQVEKTLLEALQRAHWAAEHWQGQERAARQALAAQEHQAAQERQALDAADRERRKLAAILARKEKRTRAW